MTCPQPDPGPCTDDTCCGACLACEHCMGADEQARQHFADVAKAESEGRCWASGLTLPACKASICDCFDYPDVTPDEVAADRELLPDPGGMTSQYAADDALVTTEEDHRG